jgi:hypothetical protein
VLREAFAVLDEAMASRKDDWGEMFKGKEVFESDALVDPARAAAIIASVPEIVGTVHTGAQKRHAAGGGANPRQTERRSLARRRAGPASSLAE